MGRSRYIRSRKASLISSKETDGQPTAATAITRAGGSGFRGRGLTRSDFLTGPDMAFPLMERINHPVTFELDSLHEADPDDDIWPPATRMPERGVVVLGHTPRSDPVVPANAVQWDEQSIHQAVRLSRERGFVPGAIVAAKPLLGSGMDWKVKTFVHWGVVISLHTYIPGQAYTVYAPIEVRWFVPQNHTGRVTDKLFPADLYLIHSALTEETITAKMKQQQEDYS